MTTKIICATCGAPWYNVRKAYCHECLDYTKPLVLVFVDDPDPEPTPEEIDAIMRHEWWLENRVWTDHGWDL